MPNMDAGIDSRGLRRWPAIWSNFSIAAFEKPVL
jgi:hypothetical protein